MRVIQRDAPGQRNTWLELVIKCSRQFRKRVTVTVCNCRTLRGFQFDRAAPRICILCVLYATRILSCNGYYEIRSRLKTLSLSLLSLSLSLSRSLYPSSSFKCRYKRVTSVPLDVASLWVPRFTEPLFTYGRCQRDMQYRSISWFQYAREQPAAVLLFNGGTCSFASKITPLLDELILHYRCVPVLFVTFTISFSRPFLSTCMV